MQSLALPFYVDCGVELGTDVKLYGPSSVLWKGKFVKKSKSIEGLTEMMTFYGIKPYYMVVMKYEGEDKFKFEVYNPYAVEITYPFDGHASTLDLTCNSIEVDKLECNFLFNALGNFQGVFRLHIEPKHILGCTFTEVTFQTSVC